MMKKNGFTLAEVLITLAIIGVVATLTLPSLLTNTAEQQSMTAFKKAMNTLNEAGQMNAALEGFDFSISTKGTLNDSIQLGNQSLAALFNERLQVSKAASQANFPATAEKCKAAPVFVLRDGIAICLGEAAYNTTSQYWSIYVDTNGAKGPNVVSKCKEEGCTTKSERLIKDQFPVTLVKGVAIPGHWSNYEEEAKQGADFAARYAMGIGTRK